MSRTPPWFSADWRARYKKLLAGIMALERLAKLAGRKIRL